MIFSESGLGPENMCETLVFFLTKYLDKGRKKERKSKDYRLIMES